MSGLSVRIPIEAPDSFGDVQAWIVGEHELPEHLAGFAGLTGMVVVETRPGDPIFVYPRETFDLRYKWV
jgi:hypothetical protein